MLKPDLVDRAVEAIKGYAQYQYFFEHLDSPEWLQPLAERGLFKQPPPPQEVDRYVRLPFWPESRYLVRMASIPEAQASVVQIARAIPTTENSRVYDDIVDIALALPAPHAAELLDQIAVGVRLPIKLTLQNRIGDLINRLASGGEATAALRLTSLILALAPDPSAERQEEEAMWPSPEPQPLLRDWYYAQIIETSLKSLVQAAGLDAVRVFVYLLNDAIGLSRRSSEDAEDEEDYLYITCPNIEHGRGRDDIRVILIAAVRDAAEQLIAADTAQFGAVIRLLDSKRWVTFRRLKLHLCRVFPELGLAVAGDMLTDAEMLLRGSLQHEIVLLLKTSFGRLTGETQRKILTIMDAGLSDDAHRRWLEFTGQPVTAENVKRLADMGRRDHYAILRGQLPPDYQQKLNELVACLGEPRVLGEPKMRSFGGAFGAQSPKPDKEIEAMSVEEILEFARSWKPGTEIFQPTAEGFGKSLTARVAKDPAPFLAHAKGFEGLDPTYVRAFFGGVQSALNAKVEFDWGPVLELAAWVVQQPREILGRKGGLMVADPDWGWTRDSIIDLISAGLKDAPNGGLTLELREKLWRILRPLTEDPSPSVSDEMPDPQESASPVLRRFSERDERTREPDLTSISINKTRGRAMHAVFQYARWIRLCSDAQRATSDEPNIDLRAMPEVREVLEVHLDVTREPTRTIRSIYGDHLTLLAWLDWPWLEANLARILPLAKADYALFNAAWRSFIVFNRPNTTLLRAMMSCYRKAIGHLGKDVLPRHSVKSPEDSLAEHLMVFYWLGALDFGAEDHLLDEFYVNASDHVRGHAIWFVGTSVAGWQDEVQPEVFPRLQALFDKRLAQATYAAAAVDFSSEMANFGHWFISEKFDDDWSIRQLLAALRVSTKVSPEMDVVKRLSELCPQYPVECVACLHLIIEGDADGWILLGIENDARALLSQALASSHPDGALSARRLIEELIAKGQFSFRTLLG